MESDVDLEAMSAAPRYLEGYPTFAEFIAKDKDAAIYRRFENLRARNLLYLQDELHELERKLEELDEKDAKGMMSFVAHIHEPWLKLDGRAHHTDRPGTSTSKFATPSGNKVAKIKRGLPGFVNGSRTSALADTGAAQNIVSAAFAQEKGVSLGGQAAVFRLGNNKKARSIGKIEEAILIIAFSLNTC